MHNELVTVEKNILIINDIYNEIASYHVIILTNITISVIVLLYTLDQLSNFGYDI